MYSKRYITYPAGLYGNHIDSIIRDYRILLPMPYYFLKFAVIIALLLSSYNLFYVLACCMIVKKFAYGNVNKTIFRLKNKAQSHVHGLNMRISHPKKYYITIDYFAYGNVNKSVLRFQFSIIRNKSTVITIRM